MSDGDDQSALPTVPSSEEGDASESEDIQEAEAEEEPETVIPVEVQEALKGIPSEHRSRIERVFSMFQYQGPLVPPFFSKISEQHIDKLIDGSQRDSQRMYDDRKETRGHNKFLTIVYVVAFLAVAGLFLWAKQTDLLKEVITLAVVFGGGLGLGHGIGRSRQ